MQGISTRDKLIETAQILFQEKGYRATSVTDILCLSGVSRGSFCHYFPAKRDLLLAVLEAHRQQTEMLFRDVTDEQQAAPIEQAFNVIQSIRQTLISTDYMCTGPIDDLTLKPQDGSGEIQARVTRIYDAWLAALEEILRREGSLRENIGISDLAHVLLTSLIGSVLLSRAKKSVEPFDASMRLLRQQIECLTGEGKSRNSTNETGRAR